MPCVRWGSRALACAVNPAISRCALRFAPRSPSRQRAQISRRFGAGLDVKSVSGNPFTYRSNIDELMGRPEGEISNLAQDVAYLWKHRSAANKAMDLGARRQQAEETLRAARQQLRDAEAAREAAIVSALRQSSEDINRLNNRLTQRHRSVMDSLDEADHRAASATAASATASAAPAAPATATDTASTPASAPTTESK